MRILCVSHHDSGGNAYFTAQAVNRRTDHEARAVRMVQSKLKYPYDVLAPDEDEIRRLYDWADVVHARDARQFLPANDKPCLMTYSGRAYRKAPAQMRAHCESRGWLLSVSTPDLTALDNAPWMPNPRPDLVEQVQDNWTAFTVCQTITNNHRRQNKGTDAVAEALAVLPKVRFDLIENLTYEKCQRRRMECHATVDQFRFGYGNSAVEAWAMGQPVVSGAMPRFREALIEQIGFVPFYEAAQELDSIREAVETLRSNRLVRRETGAFGRACYVMFHSEEAVARRALELYEMTIDTRGKI